MKKEDQITLITRHLQEIVDLEKIEHILETRDLKIYWGTAPTGKPHFGYFVPMFKIADFLRAGCHVTILFADLHAYLDNMKSTWELLDKRTEYYEFIIKEMLTQIGVPLEKLHFKRGREFQLNPQYTLDMYKIATLASTKDTQKAGAEVVKQMKNPKMGGLLYPILQALDEQYLDVDAQFGGVDQRKIFMFAREFLPKIHYKKRIHLMNPLVPGLGQEGKMSSSNPFSKIDFDDSPALIRKKINKSFCRDGEIENNGLLAMMKFVIFRRLADEKRDFVVERPEKYGGRQSFHSYTELEVAFQSKALSSIDLKQGLAQEIIRFLQPIAEKIKENMTLLNEAYPK